MSELLARLTTRELAEWRAYYAIQGEAAVVDDLKRTALANLPKRRR